MTDPAPLVPAEVDLRDFQFMPLDIVRLFNSEFHAASSDAEWRAGVTLWLKSYHQVPAASLPDDDVALARLAELGRDTRAWRKVRAGALRGWVRCSDGRLYHPVVAEKAMSAWEAKIARRDRTEKARLARLSQKENSDTRRSVTESVTEPVTTPVTASKGQGQGQGELKRKKEEEERAPAAATDQLPPRTPYPGHDLDAAQAGLTVGLPEVWANFADWHEQHGKPVASVAAAWRRWCRREATRIGQQAAAEPQPSNPEADQWRQRLKGWRKSRFWLGQHWGPEPGQPGCRCPPEIIAEVTA